MRILDLQKNTFKGEIESQAIQLLRQRGSESFEKLNWPTKKNERWKYTSLKELGDLDFIYPQGSLSAASKSQVEALKLKDFFNIVFINGVFQAALSDLSNLVHEVRIGDLNEAISSGTLNGSEISDFKDGLEALSFAFLKNGLYLKVESNRTVSKPIQLLFIQSSEVTALSSSRVYVELGFCAKLELLETHLHLTEAGSVAQTVVDLRVDQNASLTYTRTSEQAPTEIDLGQTNIRVYQGAQLQTNVWATGGKVNRHELQIKFLENNAKAEVFGAYLGTQKDHIDLQSNIEFIKEGNSSNQLYKGILDGNSKGIFNGRVFINKGAQKTESSQLNNNLLISNSAEIDSKPQLEIFVDDVKASHGSTVGDLNEDEIFYLQSRGIDIQTSRRLLAQGFLFDIVERNSSASIKRVLESALTAAFKKVNL